MRSEKRWDELGALFERAQDLPPDDRAAFLSAHCRDDEMRREIASLLESADQAVGFFSDAADVILGHGLAGMPTAGAPAPHGRDPLELEGRRVVHYEVGEYIGGGGMGVVYRARDTRLGRIAALKFLPPHLAASDAAERRFMQEARAASALDHPNIATIYDIGRTESGRRFIAMAYYDGETLKTKIGRGTLPVGEALEYAAQVAEALAEAHTAGIVHRDVKPANVIVTAQGVVKLVDFGLAQAADQAELNGPNMRLGTVAYMSAEQAAGEGVDARSDLWSLGVMLYEMLAGKRPFQGDHPQSVIHSILNDEPESLKDLRPDVPIVLCKLVDALLQKYPAGRPPHARAVSTWLEKAARGKDLRSVWTERSRRATAARMFAVVVGLGIAIWLAAGGPSSPTSSTVAGESIAVLPFEVSGTGAEEWGEGMVTTLSTGLDGAAGLRAVADRTIFAAWEQFEPAQVEGAANRALAVARRIGSEYAVDGSVVTLGSRLRIVARVHETNSGREIGRAQVEGRPDGLMAMADALTLQVLRILLDKSEHLIPSINLASITTESLPAYKSYLQGERHLRAGAGGSRLETAIESFQAAIRADSAFALPHARLAVLGLFRREAAGQYTEKAYALSDKLPERNRRLIRTLHLGRIEGRTLAAADSFRALAEAYPDDPTVWKSYGEFLYHAYVPNGWPEIERALERAVELDPKNGFYYTHNTDYALRIHNDSALAAKRVAAMPQNEYKVLFRIAIDMIFGSDGQREQAFARLDTIPSPFFSPIVHSLFGFNRQEMTDAILRRVLEHPSLGEPGKLADRRNWNRRLISKDFARGDIRQAIADLQRVSVSAEEAARILSGQMSLGVPIPDSILSAYLDPNHMEKGARVGQLQCAGIFLIERGRMDELPDLLDRIRDAGPSQRTPDVRIENVIAELKGYQVWKAGDLTEAARWWSRGNEARRAGAIWRGDLFRELGQLRRAERWYTVAWRLPVAHERLGGLYDVMGRPEDAASAYERFIESWRESDEPLQERVALARERLRELRKAG